MSLSNILQDKKKDEMYDTENSNPVPSLTKFTCLSFVISKQQQHRQQEQFIIDIRAQFKCIRSSVSKGSAGDPSLGQFFPEYCSIQNVEKYVMNLYATAQFVYCRIRNVCGYISNSSSSSSSSSNDTNK